MRVACEVFNEEEPVIFTFLEVKGMPRQLCVFHKNKLDNAVVLEVENFQVQQYKEGGENPWRGQHRAASEVFNFKLNF